MASSRCIAAASLSLPLPSTIRGDSSVSLRSYFCWKRVTLAAAVNHHEKAVTTRRRNVTVKATGVAKFKGTHMKEKQLTEMIQQKVSEAKQVCEGDETTDECKVAWDEVEEISQAKADLRRKLQTQDPLEFFCQDNPETDECRIYED
ncbi:hypothetical protein ACOSP7_011373 [Xanthoceras sorbifolium]|uniref:CP12 domain-containing protein n=1 Tax=Xanthoceras sorbifolium TaxID=99658 RepID=A0ABQ8H098_9ROSI|nr:hypothetical protein JRO89_XSUnG0020300 [Xanthoceras sorbifolium]